MAPRKKTWWQEFGSLARYDKVKLNFPDIHPAHRLHVQDVLDSCIEQLGAEYPGLRVNLPKLVEIGPSPNKPNGMYIVDLQGFVAECVKYMPAGWLSYVTYAHVKTFVRPVGGDTDENVQSLIDRPGSPRAHFIGVRPRGNRDASKAPGKAFTIGSGKSGLHLNLYRRPGQPWGMEGKFRDEQVHHVTMAVLDMKEQGQVSDRGAWEMAAKMWGDKAGRAWELELMHRGLKPRDAFETTTYTWWKAEQQELDV
jgi:hypothetical protein